jgi:hypothetical protein
MSDAKVFSKIDDLFSASIDDLADLPAFEAPPPGSYILTVGMSVKQVNNKDVVEAAFTVNETVELSDGNDTPVIDGTKFSMIFMIDNEFGIGNLKKFLKPFQEHYGVSNIGALVNEIKDVQISALIKNRKDKNDPDKVYASVSNITVM